MFSQVFSELWMELAMFAVAMVVYASLSGRFSSVKLKSAKKVISSPGSSPPSSPAVSPDLNTVKPCDETDRNVGVTRKSLSQRSSPQAPASAPVSPELSVARLQENGAARGKGRSNKPRRSAPVLLEDGDWRSRPVGESRRYSAPAPNYRSPPMRKVALDMPKRGQACQQSKPDDPKQRPHAVERIPVMDNDDDDVEADAPCIFGEKVPCLWSPQPKDEPKEVPSQVTFEPAVFHREMSALLQELAMDRNTGTAVKRIRAQMVPREHQAREFADLLTRTAEENRGAARFAFVALAASLASSEQSPFHREECLRGFKVFFDEIYADLCIEIPRLPRMAAVEILPTFYAVLSSKELDPVVPADVRARFRLH